jgi:DNA topoisomerase-3
VTKESIESAMVTLGAPNRNEALAVDARQELDLKIGQATCRIDPPVK